MKQIDTISVLHFIVLALLVYRVTRVIVIDHVLTPLRERIWDKFNPEDSYIGYFFTCPWCVSLWVSLVVIIFYAFFPSTLFIIGCIFSLSAIAGLITARLDD